MEEIPLNIYLGKEIERWLSVRGKTKAALANFMEMDPAVMSLMLKGQILPSRSELEKIILHLSVDKESREKMRRAVTFLMLHPRGKTAWDSASLKAMRLRRGMTLPMLSNRTGIMTSRLALLELKNAALPTEEEEVKLRHVFETSGSSYDRFESEYVDTLDLKSSIVPVLRLADLKNYRRGMGFEQFIAEYSVEDTLWTLNYTGPAAIVIANCEDLRLSLPGVAAIAVGEYDDSFAHKMELWFEPEKGLFSLCELVNKTWKLSVFSNQNAEFTLREWALPVLDLVFKPYDLEMEGRER